MKFFIQFVMITLVAALFIACGDMVENKPAVNNTAAANTEKKPAGPPAPTMAALIDLEKKAWEAWKNRDGKYFEGFMTDNYVSFAPSGRVNKEASIKAIADPNCEIKSYTFSDEKMTMLGVDAAVLTFKAAQDYSCDGKPGPKEIWAADVYVRDGENWKSAYYNEVVVIDPKAGGPKPGMAVVKSAGKDEKPQDALTADLAAVEHKGWEAWKNRDAAALESVVSKDLVLIDLFGSGRLDQAAALKAWTEPTCEIKSFSIRDAQSVAVTKDVGLLTFKGAPDGQCDNQRLLPIWGTTVFVKDGDAWKAALIFETPLTN